MGKYLQDEAPRKSSKAYSSRPGPITREVGSPKQELVDEVLRAVSRRINHFGTGGGGVNALAADKVLIADLLNNYAAPDVEAALAELASASSPAKANDANVLVQITATGSVAQTQHGVNNLSWYLESFGAVGDGVTDDAPAFATAMAGIGSANATLNGSPGKTYLIGAAGIAVTSKTSVRIVGNGAKIKLNAVATQSPSGLLSTAIFLDTCTNVTFTGWEIDGNAKASNVIGLKSCTDCEVSFNKINSGGLSGLIFALGNTRTRYLFNTLSTTTGSSRGMWLGNYATGHMEADVLILGNTVTGCPATGIVCASVGGRIEGNHVSALTAGSGIIFGGAGGFSSKYLSIVGNVCRSIGGNGHGIQSDVVYTTIADVPVGIVIANNVCELNTGSGIYAIYMNGGTLSGNVCVNNNDGGAGSGHGIIIDEVKDLSVYSNYCCDTRSGGARTQNNGIDIVVSIGTNDIQNLSVAGNICNNNLSIGILVVTNGANVARGLSINSNQCNDNSVRGISVAETTVGAVTRLSVVGNICAGNTTTDLRVDPLDAAISDNIFTIGAQVAFWTFTDADTTPSVLGARKQFRANNTAGTSITTLDDAVDGQSLSIYAANGNTTLVNGTIVLKGGVNTTIPANGIIDLWFNNTLWFEVSRSY